MAAELTEEQVRKQFLDYVRACVTHWETTPDRETIRERLDGLAFSILVAIDGEASDLPPFILAPISSEEDKQYGIEHGQDWYAVNDEAQAIVKCDIAGNLHNEFYKQ